MDNKRNPRLKIKNVQCDIDRDNSILENITSLNDVNVYDSSDFKIVTTLKLKSNNRNVVVEVTPEIRKQLLDKAFVWVGLKKCMMSVF